MKTYNPRVQVFEFLRDALESYADATGQFFVIADLRGWHPTAKQHFTGFTVDGITVEPYMKPAYYVCSGSPGLIRPFEKLILYKNE